MQLNFKKLCIYMKQLTKVVVFCYFFQFFISIETFNLMLEFKFNIELKTEGHIYFARTLLFIFNSH